MYEKVYNYTEILVKRELGPNKLISSAYRGVGREVGQPRSTVPILCVIAYQGGGEIKWVGGR